ncbi:hypothetical protein FFK22_032890 [Mycobacterium sp. KBS0706]|uniref:hypothetical protein n=1 Tax=Mycobacterium sp. KBS0706 TaxID=2578109 RepID=UPI00110FB026|nr:hypothetical protein [Mycobacterium sp. KBS0706]TSD84409.1 hypothetical protein FFK22_032890 [Mycobacterium sp. KBS0706]
MSKGAPGVEELFRHIDKPAWLPVYDLRRYAAKVDDECGYGSDMMVGMVIEGALFEEVLAFLNLCAAFARMYTRQRPYKAAGDAPPGALERALAENAQRDCPTYTGLIELFLRAGVIGETRGIPG